MGRDKTLWYFVPTIVYYANIAVIVHRSVASVPGRDDCRDVCRILFCCGFSDVYDYENARFSRVHTRVSYDFVCAPMKHCRGFRERADYAEACSTFFPTVTFFIYPML